MARSSKLKHTIITIQVNMSSFGTTFSNTSLGQPECIKYQHGKVLKAVLAGDITPHYPGSSASVTTETAPLSQDLTHRNIEEWNKTTTENESFFGSNYAPTIWSEVPSTTSRAFIPLIVPTESEAGSLRSERVQDARWEGRLSIEATDAQKPQHQQRIRNNPEVSPQEDIPARTSFTLELANMMAKAESGDHVAQETLGDMYMDTDDRITPTDVQTAINWYLRAHSQGRIGNPIERKLRLPDDFYSRFKFDVMQECLTAVDRRRKAADQGDSTAQCNIGVMYFVAAEYCQAMIWYRKAAKQGDAAAQRNIGNLYHQGLGVSQDYVEAMTWYRKAAEQGEVAAQNEIGNLYQEGLGVSEDYAEAMAWFRKAAEQGHARAHYNIRNMYSYGYGVPRDYAEASTWLRKAAEHGDPYSRLCQGPSLRKWTRSQTRWF
ncbi:hypothetical protein EC957_001738 [Mortierella hygrophila]|uniref:HCP-like protein n=1 Tax=Mortierella hygrophila TaxID=979708 RepID=A0A9P6K2G6_9FUNG|nr:hypothetical protein EC957_001738 [Mortierella hygrophila]